MAAPPDRPRLQRGDCQLLLATGVERISRCHHDGAGLPTASAAAATATVAPASGAAFLPLAVGDSWSYRQNSEPPVNWMITITAVSSTADGVITAAVTQTFVVTPAIADRRVPTPFTYAVLRDGSVEKTERAAPYLVFPPADVIRSGQVVPVGVGGGLPVSNGTGHGARTGTVPAGSFTAQLFEVDATLPGPQPFPGLAQGPGPPIQERTTYWLADKIGIVRVLQTSDGSPFIQELQQYHLVS